MMKTICFTLATVLTSIPAMAAAAQSFPEERSYSNHLFRTIQECKEAQHGGMWFNCNQTIKFQTDGSATVMVTDIPNPATYTIDGDQVTVKRKGEGDMAAQIKFRLDRTQRNLVLKANHVEVWELE